MNYEICLPHKVIQAEEGACLLDVLRLHNEAPEALCGGNGKCGKCLVLVDGEKELSCKYKIKKNIQVDFLPNHKNHENQILTDGLNGHHNINPGNSGYLAAFDIGTTSVVCFLMNPQGEQISVSSMLNPQSPFGADVISRMQHAIKGGLEELTRVIRTGTLQLLQDCCRQAQITLKEIGVICVVANPCMQQLFLGISPENLTVIPFAPVLTKSAVVPAKEFFPECINADFLIVPDISGYVGADTMGCVLSSALYEAADNVLMVDIGTNGEMVLSHHGNMYACSTAAGPALEGANICCGMRACTGAIDHVWTEGGKICYSVIGNTEAAGICGSGLIDLTAVLLEENILNQRGRIQTENHDFILTEKVNLTQEDVRQVQMAKGAITAGIMLMAKEAGITVEQIDRVILAGAFGSYLDPQNACRIGLLPRELEGKILTAGNIAGTGSRMLAADRDLLKLTDELIANIQFLELAKLPDFQKTFAKCMRF